MSMCGNFFALSDRQLERMLNDVLDYSKFLYNELDEKPAECFSHAEYCWNDVREILTPEDACGMDITDSIPEMSGYSFSSDVKAIAASLERLNESEIKDRHAELSISTDLNTINDIVRGLVEFYQRAARNGNAVLFRVT